MSVLSGVICEVDFKFLYWPQNLELKKKGIMNKYKAIDLFCGAGGLTIGLKKAGFEVVAGVEINAAAVETYSINHKNHRVYETDIRELSPQKIMDEIGIKKGELDLLAGCPPCQGFSTHRTRNKSTSIPDERNNLVFEFVRFVEEFLPKTIMMENVPGLAKDKSMKEVISQLTNLGYIFNDETVVVRDAAEYGVPQRRRRMIMLASRFGEIIPPKPAKITRTVRDTIGGLELPEFSKDPLHNMVAERSLKVRKIIKLIPKDGGSRSDIPKRYWLECHKRRPYSYQDVYGRMSWDKPSPTITGGCHQPSKGRFIHPEQDRSISLREAALLQTFPKSYKFSLSKGKDGVALMIGNALPPEFIKRQAITLVKHLEESGKGTSKWNMS